MPEIKRILIANRGEIALRIHRAAQIPVGARIRFNVIRPFAEIEPEQS